MNTKQIILLVLALLVSRVTFSQVAIGAPTPHASAILEVKSNVKGFLPPRMSDAQRDAIGTPPNGLTIYNTTEKCLQWFDGSFWFSGCNGLISPDPVTGGETDNGFQNNTFCASKLISVTPCSAVNGATQSSSQPHSDGTLYDWTDATSYMGGTTTAALVEIGGQCWFGRNSNTPSPYTGTNSFDGYHNNGATEPAVGEGRLYQWNAAMNGVSGLAADRAQGVCPTGWHVPSDCEWMYLENTLDMSTIDQQVNNAFRNSGSVGSKLSNFTSGATNSSGFTALLAGFRDTNGNFSTRSSFAYWWSSSETSTTDAQRRRLNSNQAGVNRNNNIKTIGFSVRCLKD